MGNDVGMASFDELLREFESVGSDLRRERFVLFDDNFTEWSPFYKTMVYALVNVTVIYRRSLRSAGSRFGNILYIPAGIYQNRETRNVTGNGGIMSVAIKR